jgi:site-specific DNA recombinase
MNSGGIKERNNMKRAGIYIRVSTMEQVEHGFSIDEQRERLLAYCKAMGWSVVAVYVDGAYSGSNMDRPGLQKMLTEIKSLDVVVIYKLDRLSRSQKDTLSLIEDTFIKNSVDIVSLQENLDTSTSFGRAAIGIMSAFAQLERETFKERSILGRTGRARKGKWVGSGRAPIGYDYDPAKQQLNINPHEAEQVKEVFNLYLQGVSLQNIAKTMYTKGYKHKYGNWTSWGGVITMLRNSVYTGKVKFDGKVFDGQHDAIIDDKTFTDIQNLLDNRSTGQLYKRRSPFSHLLYCADCNSKMFYLNRKNSYNRNPIYICNARYGNKNYYDKELISCKMRRWPAHLLEEAIMSQIKILATNKRNAIKAISAESPVQEHANKHKIVKRADDLSKQINKLIELYQNDIIPVDELNRKIKELHEERTSVQAIILSIEEAAATKTRTVEIMMDTAKEINDNWDNIEIGKRIELVSILINKIVVGHDNIDIIWNFGTLAHD